MQGSLIVLQPTTRCNIDCSYCYLADRSKANKMSLETLELLASSVFRSNRLSSPITFCWHSGEPLLAGIDFFRSAIALIDRCGARSDKTWSYAVQTNATSIDDTWVDFFRTNRFQVGISIDGHEEIHDKFRKTRNGKGTHKIVMDKVKLLRRGNIPYTAVCVVTKNSLSCPDEIFDFFNIFGASTVGFSIEEAEGENVIGSINADSFEQLRCFWRRMFENYINKTRHFQIREFERLFYSIRTNNLARSNYEAGAIVTCSWDGRLSTFCPELIGQKSEQYGNFVFANVADGVDAIFSNEHFRSLDRDLKNSHALCRSSCPEYDLCLGGQPANKYFEHGSFMSTETVFCIANRKLQYHAVMDVLRSLKDGRDG